MFLLTEARYFPAALLQTSPPRPQSAGAIGAYQLIDLDLSRYNQIAARFARERQESTTFLKFREDLLARINVWVFELPALRERREDIEPNIDYELERFAASHDTRVRFNAEARREYLAFATAGASVWAGNFRELSASVTRLATLAEGGRITLGLVHDEIARLGTAWLPEPAANQPAALLSAAALAQSDLFDRLQLEAVVDVCRTSRSAADAGRRLFGVSRTRRSVTNDTGRLKKYLARFGLDWAALQGHGLR